MIPPRAAPRISWLAAAFLWLSALAAHPAFAELPVARAEIVKSYPHDADAFTQGLLFHRGFLYESTGLEGRSTIRQVDLATGRVVKSASIPPHLFGEGLVNWGDQLISVTWRGGQGFRWSLQGFQQIGRFRYDGEGWGLTQDGRHIILSDGTAVLRFLDPRTLAVVRRVRVTAQGKPIDRLNELEYVRGEILANVWMTNFVARIDPRTGAVKGWIDLGPIAARFRSANHDAVPNGIAYDARANRLFVTGKLWPQLFEIRNPVGK